MRQTPTLLVALLLPGLAHAVDGDRQTPDAAGDTYKPVPWVMPNLQIQSWLTLWDQDEDPQADAGGYGDPELDTGFTIRRARFGLAGGWKSVDFSLRIGTGRPYDTLSSDPPPVDLIDGWARFSVNSLGGTTRISVGRQRVPFSREQLISSNDLIFQDTSVSTSWLAPSRDLGAMLSHDYKAFGFSAGVYNGDGDMWGNADNGVMAVGRLEAHIGGDTYRTNAGDSAFGVGAAYIYNHQIATDTHRVGADLLARYQGLTLMGEFDLNLIRPDVDPTVLPPDVPVQTTRMGAMAQLSYYREVGIGAVEPAVRFSWLDDAKHLKDNGDVAVLDAGLSWREPIPFIDLGAGYIHRFELQGRATENDSVRVWAGLRYPSRKFRPFDIVQALRDLGARPLEMEAGDDHPPRKQKKPRD